MSNVFLCRGSVMGSLAAARAYKIEARPDATKQARRFALTADGFDRAADFAKEEGDLAKQAWNQGEALRYRRLAETITKNKP
jgi:hypothetical protein